MGRRPRPETGQRSRPAGAPRRRELLYGLAASPLALPALTSPVDSAAPGPARTGVPHPRQLLGIDFTDRPFTLAESDRYLTAVAAASPRVRTGVSARSWQGRPVRYAIVAGPELLTDQALAAARRRRALLRDPTTSPAAIQAAVARTQAVAWVVAGVHGSERSGTNAVLRVLYDLATGTEAPASQLLRAAVVVVVPVQNPDGHHAGVRFNSAGFDLNRDWFAATQPETAGLLGLVRQYPPQLLLDLHEKNGTGYFVPPYTDPIHHEVPASVLAWTEQRYGAAIAERFRADGVDFVTGREFDLFYPGHSDTACALSTLAPGLTLEKGQASPFSDRVRQHTSASWAALSTLAAGGRDALWEWHLAHREAYQQGLRGVLAPGVRPGAPVDRRLVRHYFLPPQRGRSAERDLVVRRLLLAGVQVHRLTRQLSVPDLRPYGRPAAPAVLPKGTYWIPTAQAGKHWVQAMLGESSYPSGGVFFDTTAWSLPLLANIAGGSSGAELTPAAEPVTSVRAPRPPARAVRPPRLPRLAVLHTMPPTLPGSAARCARDRWDAASGHSSSTARRSVPPRRSTGCAGRPRP